MSEFGRIGQPEFSSDSDSGELLIGDHLRLSISFGQQQYIPDREIDIFDNLLDFYTQSSQFFLNIDFRRIIDFVCFSVYNKDKRHISFFNVCNLVLFERPLSHQLSLVWGEFSKKEITACLVAPLLFEGLK